MFHAQFDFANGGDLHYLLGLLKKSYPSNEIQVLFMHPSPGMDERNTYALAGKQCIDSLKKKYITSVFFVYDILKSNSKKKTNCWSYKSLLECFLSLTNSEKLKISESCIISEKKQDTMQHPIFNNIRRKGWAAVRKGEEHCFFITYS